VVKRNEIRWLRICCQAPQIPVVGGITEAPLRQAASGKQQAVDRDPQAIRPPRCRTTRGSAASTPSLSCAMAGRCARSEPDALPTRCRQA